MTYGEFRQYELTSGRARLDFLPGWHLCCDDLYRKDRPLCKDNKHNLDGWGGCRNCDFALKPAEETATGR